MRQIFNTFVLSLSFLFYGFNLFAQESLLTPLTLKVLAAPIPVKGSDGALHLVYELQLTNASSLAWRIQSLEIMSTLDSKSSIVNWQGTDLKKRIELLGVRSPTDRLEPSQSAIAWITLSFANEKKLPSSLVHRLQLNSEKQPLTEIGGAVEVIKQAPVVIQAPLRGDRWIAADGCCEAKRHIRALLPVKGALYTAQRFAIDWEKMGEKDTIYEGNPLKVESYFCYGLPIFAAADGRVVGSQDGLPNQIPGNLPAGLRPEEADGNHVIQEIAPGHYALYAHMIPGSLKVKTGDVLKKGQVIGLVGNSGNSSAPHLHFHVMDSPSALGSNGLPYVFAKFEAKGKTPGTAAFDEAEAKGTPLKILPISLAGTHRDELPLDQWVVEFKE